MRKRRGAVESERKGRRIVVVGVVIDQDVDAHRRANVAAVLISGHV